MAWINLLERKLNHFAWLKLFNVEQKLMLVIIIPSLIICIVSLVVAQVSYYLIAFITIVYLLIAGYALLAIKQNADFQIRTLSNLIESMIDGDYSLRGRLQTNQAFQELLNLINRLSDTLAKHKFEAKESRLLLERILAQMHAFVLATDAEGQVVMANASAKKYLFDGIDSEEKISLPANALGAAIMNANPGIVSFKQAPLVGEYFLVKEPFLSGGEQHQLYFISNAEQLLMEQERKAWQSLLRVLSHEMNNSLAPIAAISQAMQSKLAKQKTPEHQSLLEGVNIINERALSLTTFIASYSRLSHLPKPNMSVVNLAQLLTSTAGLFPDLDTCIADTCDIDIKVDKSQFEQVLINVFKNAVEAMSAQPQAVLETFVDVTDSQIRLTLRDQGCGIANLDNVFVPFYSTKTSGSGIGLALCRQIMFNHQGQIAISNRQHTSGVEVLLTLPKDLGDISL
ncbi:ATP-binding protein [Thalassotalea sp. G2M2-11]|uniref:sensor histidine kinase n=1 Tax=Thalassotalea sp. G2M2-11 TaxID=2787627 RepID=UPI0019D17688|nr:ATP-binding protein [Thalassotalea sp. G2M2-11]